MMPEQHEHAHTTLISSQIIQQVPTQGACTQGSDAAQPDALSLEPGTLSLGIGAAVRLCQLHDGFPDLAVPPG